MSNTVMSVTGPVDADDLGRVLVHEHIIISLPGEELDPGYAPDRAEIEAMAIGALEELHDHGVGAIVDPCPIDMGRDPDLYAKVSQKSGVKIIFATGFYMEAMGIPHYWRARTKEEIAELYLRELEFGVGDTGFRPGVIKAATGNDVTTQERKILSAAAMAQKDSGVAIITHTEHSRHGDVQQAIFEENGADLSRVMIGHQDENASANPIKSVAQKGSFVGIDRVGIDMLATDDHRADLAADIVRSGFKRHLCLSQDCVCTLSAPKFPFAAGGSSADYLSKNKPLSHVLTKFADKLRDRGVTDEDLDAIFRDNPRRLLAGA